MTTTLSPYLSFNGNTREAFAFYEKALGGQIKTMMSFDQMPATEASNAESCGGAAPSGSGIMHACLELPGGATLMAGDPPPGMPYQPVSGVMMALEFDTVAEAEKAFESLSVDGQVTMPMAATFWAQIFGMVTDRFGVAWAINGGPLPMPAAS